MDIPEQDKQALMDAFRKRSQPKEGGAAFGVYPSSGKRPEKLNVSRDVNMPAQTARGWVAGTLGLPGDIEGLGRMLINMAPAGQEHERVTGKSFVSETPFLPTSDFYREWLPGYDPAPAAKFASGLGALAGGAGSTKVAGAAVKGAQATGKALGPKAAEMAEGYLQKSGLAPTVVKPKGGNWLSGSVEGTTRPLKRQGVAVMPLNEEEAADYARRGYTEFDEATGTYSKPNAVDQWIDSKLNKYIKNEMGTPEDPVRKLAERGILHFDPEAMPRYMEDVWAMREKTGFPAMQGTSPLAQKWEAYADQMVRAKQLGEPIRSDKPLGLTMKDYIASEPSGEWALKAPDEQMVYELRRPGTSSSQIVADELGLPHLIDELRNATRADSDLPANLRWKPEDLKKVTMEQAVERVAKINEYRAAKKAEANEVLARNPATAPYKDYETVPGTQEPNQKGLAWKQIKSPEPALEEGYRVVKDEPFQSNWQVVPHPEGNGFALRAANGEFASNLNGVPERKWATAEQARADISNYADVWEPDPDELYKLVDSAGNVLARGQTESKVLSQLKRSEREKALADALKYEGDVMGHCVGGYCDDVLEGRSQIYSLRDKKGEPHVTIEVAPVKNTAAETDWFVRQPESVQDEITAEAIAEHEAAKKSASPGEDRHYYGVALSNAIKRRIGEFPPEIIQIKGKGNAAPKEEYLPFVQDFVRSGNWSRVGDFANTGLYSADDVVTFMPKSFEMSRNARQLAIGRARQAGDLPKYMTMGEYEQILKKYAPEDIWKDKEPGYAKGGLVQDTDAIVAKLTGMDKDKALTQALRMANAKQEAHMAAGGLAKVLKGAKAAKEAEEAVKPAIRGTYQALPLQLPRAPNLPPQELTKTAERIARQQAGEHVRKAPNKSENLAGRSMKEVERLKKLDIDIRPTKQIPTPTAVPEKKGEVRIGLPGDITVADQMLMSVNGLPIRAQQEGGALYGFGKMDLEDPAFWASNRGPAQQVQNKITDVSNLFDTPDVLAMHLAMGHDAMNFAQHFADANLRAIQKKAVNPDAAKTFNEIIRAGNPSTGQQFPNFPGIENYKKAYKALQEDPEMRKWFNDRMKKDSITEPLGLPSGKEIEYAIMEPELRNMEHSLVGLSVGRMKPGAELMPDSPHQTYSHDIPGLAVGRTQELLPVDLAFPDAAAHIRRTNRPQDFTGTIQKVFPHQVVDEQYINQLGEYYNRLKQIRGYKKGGAVKKSGLSVLNKAII